MQQCVICAAAKSHNEFGIHDSIRRRVMHYRLSWTRLWSGNFVPFDSEDFGLDFCGRSIVQSAAFLIILTMHNFSQPAFLPELPTVSASQPPGHCPILLFISSGLF
jgi:hypothetical protein